MKPLIEETAQRNISFFGQIATVCPFTLCCISYDFCLEQTRKQCDIVIDPQSPKRVSRVDAKLKELL